MRCEVCNEEKPGTVEQHVTLDIRRPTGKNDIGRAQGFPYWCCWECYTAVPMEHHLRAALRRLRRTARP